MDNGPIFRWSGVYFGFISSKRLFNRNGNYIGWIENDNRVWKKDGSFLGEIQDDNYILRKTHMVTPVPKVPKVPPVSLIPRIPSINRIGRIGWKDALDGIL